MGHPARGVPDTFAEIAREEAASGLTIRPGTSLQALADRGAPFAAALTQPELVRQAQARRWTGPITRSAWTLPAEAHTRSGGPS